jgi:hypothetical protein
MKNYRLITVASAAVLGVVSIFATKPEKKLVTIDVAFAGINISGTVDDPPFTTTPNGNTVILKTSGNSIIATLLTDGLTRPVYLD